MRPLYHFTPPLNWTNDPNGPVWFDGEYHLFYQHNPLGDTWGHMSWGHAVSRDLAAWEHLPVALPEAGATMAFSGSAVVDARDTSGLGGGRPCLVAIYTAHTVAPDGSYHQAQHLAASTDRGRTWQLFAGNPVLDLGLADFRDPHVIWHAPTDRWVMSVALPHEHQVRFYASDNLRDWSLLSDFGPAGATGGVWECPLLLDLPLLGDDGETGATRWLLKVDLNPGHYYGGSGAQFFAGHFDGTHFHPEHDVTAPRWVDHGRDFYAAAAWFDPRPGQPVRWVAWLNTWNYAAETPTSPWRGAMTAPRELALRPSPVGLTLVQAPARELARLRRQHVSVSGTDLEVLNRELHAAGVAGDALDIQLRVRPGAARWFGLRVFAGADQATVVGVDLERREVVVDRTRSGNVAFHPDFPGRHAAPLLATGNEVQLRLLLDRCSVEVFADDGATCLTELVFPDPAAQGVELFADGALEHVAVESWRLDPSQ